MSDTDDDSEEKVRKALRDLPRVRAKPDFEQRLARKIAKNVRQDVRQDSILSYLTSRIPTSAYSAAGLVVLAIVSYYAFFRSGAIPPPPVASDEISSASPKPTAPNGKDELAGARKDDERQKKLSAPRDEPARAPQIKSAEPAHAQASAEQSQERGRTQESAEGVSKSRVYKEEKQEALRESANLPEAPANAAPANAAPANVAPGQKTSAPQGQVQSMKASPYPVTAESYLATRDSLHIKDSLRADSLRKAKLDSLKKK
jgi:hypothetical protein